MKRLSRVVLAVGLSLLLVSALWGQTPTSVTFTASDGVATPINLTVGTAATATVGIDTILGEVEQPVTPVTGVFDARLVGVSNDLGKGVLVDYRPLFYTAQTDTYKVNWQLSDDATQTTLTLSWTADLATLGGGYWYVYAGGTRINLTTAGGTCEVPAYRDPYEFYIIHGDAHRFSTFTYDRFFSDVDLKLKHGKPIGRSTKPEKFGWPNIHNVGEDVNIALKATKTPIVITGSDAVKQVYLKDHGTLLKSFYVEKTLSFHTDGNFYCLDSIRPVGKPAKAIVKLLKALTPNGKSQNNYFFAQLATLKWNLQASGKVTPPVAAGPKLGDLLVNDGSVANGMTISAFATLCDNAISCVGSPSTATMGEYTAELAKLNAAFTSTAHIDTLTYAEGGLGWTTDPAQLALGKVKAPKKGTLKVAGWKAVAQVPWLKVNAAAGAPISTPSVVEAQPEQYQLNQNYPNPFNPTTNISFNLVNDGLVTVKIFNVLGQEVSTLANREEMTAGEQEVTFDASVLSSGVYFYQVQVNDLESGKVVFQDTKKMMLVK